IRDRNVTGVQTCALPISPSVRWYHHGETSRPASRVASVPSVSSAARASSVVGGAAPCRSDEWLSMKESLWVTSPSGKRSQGARSGRHRRQLHRAGILAVPGGTGPRGPHRAQRLAVAPRGGQRAVVDESVRGGSGTAGG